MLETRYVDSEATWPFGERGRCQNRVSPSAPLGHPATVTDNRRRRSAGTLNIAPGFHRFGHGVSARRHATGDPGSLQAVR